MPVDPVTVAEVAIVVQAAHWGWGSAVWRGHESVVSNVFLIPGLATGKVVSTPALADVAGFWFFFGQLDVAGSLLLSLRQ
jgi:hypothetical protein